MVGPVNEYEDQSAIIPFVGIMIQKDYELRQCHFVFISRRVATKKERSKDRKKSNFSTRQNVLLVLVLVRSQYRLRLISKIFQPIKVPTKICILSCVHISYKMNVSLI
jgi:hypothetical protein